MSTSPTNIYLTGSIARTFMRTALPIVALTSLNGVLSVLDAIMLGVFAGPDAIAAATLVFPPSMLLIAMATMVSTGAASILARLLGAGRSVDARRLFAGAHALSIIICIVLMVGFAVAGRPLIDALAGTSSHIADMAYAYLSVTVCTAPALFLLSLHSDALRSEGRLGFMTIVGAMIGLGNIGLNYLFIAALGLGVVGSAVGTALAQILALLVIFAYRGAGKALRTPSWRDRADWRTGWGETLALGAPRSLSFIGISLSASFTIAALRVVGTTGFDQSVTAFGIITRMMSLAFFPLLGMSLALQALVGNNAGAGQWSRSNASLSLSLGASLGYTCAVELAAISLRHGIGQLFTDDSAVLSQLDRVLPTYLALYLTFGPLMMVSSYFQALGDARRSAILALSRTYAFALPLLLLLPRLIGEQGIWLASPVADALALLVAAVMLIRLHPQRRWGLFVVR